MKQETNNEMDLLLRRLARREGVPTSNGDSHNDSDHLDADELSSYAENVLPAAARARYTEHLAECSRCRELVVQLSGSVPVVAVKETTATAPSGLTKFLASLFSPMVLRYAVPALVLIVAAGIGVVVLRSNRPGTSVAELRTAPTQPGPAATANEQPQTFVSPAQTQPRAEAKSTTTAPERRADVAEDADAPPPPNAAPVVGAVRVEPKVDASTQKAEDQAAVANPTPTPAQPAAPKPAETVDEMRVEAEGHRANRQRGVTDAARENTSVLTPSARKKSDEASDKRPAKTAAAAPTAQGAGSTGTFQMRDEDTPARSVAGRRFRKLNEVWVDTAYAAGTATTNIGRGSEQYRALIADEPEIKTIAEQLDGQFIVVWKGRAYRIR